MCRAQARLSDEGASCIRSLLAARTSECVRLSAAQMRRYVRDCAASTVSWLT